MAAEGSLEFAGAHDTYILDVWPYTLLLRISLGRKPARAMAGSWDVRFFCADLKSGHDALHNRSCHVDCHHQGREVSIFSCSWERRVYFPFMELAIRTHTKVCLTVALICNPQILSSLFARAHSSVHCLFPYIGCFLFFYRISSGFFSPVNCRSPIYSLEENLCFRIFGCYWHLSTIH